MFSTLLNQHFIILSATTIIATVLFLSSQGITGKLWNTPKILHQPSPNLDTHHAFSTSETNYSPSDFKVSPAATDHPQANPQAPPAPQEHPAPQIEPDHPPAPPTTTTSILPHTPTTPGNTDTTSTKYPHPTTTSQNAELTATPQPLHIPPEPSPPKTHVHAPYYATLESIKGAFSHPICGGAVIQKDSILTAASCFQPLNTDNERRKKYMVARVGATKAGIGGHVHEVSDVIIPRDYEVHKNTDRDLAIVKVYRPFRFGIDVTKIELTNTIISDFDPVISVVAIGFGLLRKPCEIEGSWSGKKLKQNSFELLDESSCKRQLEFLQLANMNHQRLCVFQNNFMGDKGSLLVYNNTLAGILSWEIDWHKDCIPAVYTSIAHNVAWIKRHLQKAP